MISYFSKCNCYNTYYFIEINITTRKLLSKLEKIKIILTWKYIVKIAISWSSHFN